MIYWTALMLGIFGSLHCVGMCGPIALALPLTSKEKVAVVFQSLLYQMGRVTTYTMMGLVFGLMGWGIILSGYQKIFSVSIGFLLIASALFSLSLERKLMAQNWIKTLLSRLKRKLSKLLTIDNKLAAYKVGILNGFLPCGLVYVALTGAVVSGNTITGGIYMMLFGLGTIPLMMVVMIFGKYGQKHVLKFRNLLPYVLILFGIYLIFRGMNLELPVELSFLDSIGTTHNASIV